MVYIYNLCTMSLDLLFERGHWPLLLNLASISPRRNAGVWIFVVKFLNLLNSTESRFKSHQKEQANGQCPRLFVFNTEILIEGF